MLERKLRGKLSRREFMTSGIAGICTLGLSSLLSSSNLLADAQTAHTAQMGLIKPTPSPWFESVNDILKCTLCPKGCELEEGERAPCMVRKNQNGTGYTLAYGNPALIQEDPVERKPFFHVLPGSRALSISTAGCNLECPFCEVWDMALTPPEEVYAYEISPEEVIAYAQEGNVQSISYAFGEPVIFYEYMNDISELAQKEGFLNLLHTAGYIQPEPLEELAEKMDAVNLDLKSFKPEFYQEIVGGELEAVLQTLKILWEADVLLEITNILIPTLNDDMEMIEKMSSWIAEELGTGVPLHFARFYPLYKLSDLPQTPVSTLEEARDTAMEAGLDFVYIAGVTGHEAENTFCPNCKEKIIDRVGFIIDEMKIKEGKCEHCGRKIPGKWV